ncbi:hypothetical protein Hanom_Chr08g00705861 [Helianthus anomalus]
MPPIKCEIPKMPLNTIHSLSLLLIPKNEQKLNVTVYRLCSVSVIHCGCK